jgi:folate-dependent phosphoribosylglycinamide formyltransferase PurN
MKHRVAVLCSGDSSALQSLIQLLPELPITIELIITNKTGGDNLYLQKIYNIPTSCYDNKNHGKDEDFENSILSELINFNISALLILGCSYSIHCESILDYFEDKILYFTSPLFEYHNDPTKSLQKCIEARAYSAVVAMHIYERRDTLISTSIPIYSKNPLETLTKIIQIAEKKVIVAGIDLAIECCWKQ